MFFIETGGHPSRAGNVNISEFSNLSDYGNTGVAPKFSIR